MACAESMTGLKKPLRRHTMKTSNIRPLGRHMDKVENWDEKRYKTK